jgi:hypothetical protein
VAKVGTSKAGGTISQQAAVHPWLAADAHGNKQTRDLGMPFRPNNCPLFIFFVGFWLAGQLFDFCFPRRKPIRSVASRVPYVCLYPKVMQTADRTQNKISRMECNNLKVDDDHAFDRSGVCR